jgi:hypothetical protein
MAAHYYTYHIEETSTEILRQTGVNGSGDVAIIRGGKYTDRMLNLFYKDAAPGERFDIVKAKRYGLYQVKLPDGVEPTEFNIQDFGVSSLVSTFTRKDEAEKACDLLNANGGRDVEYHCMLSAPVEFVEKGGAFFAVPNPGATAEDLRKAAQEFRDKAPKLAKWNDQFHMRVMSALMDMLADRL